MFSIMSSKVVVKLKSVKHGKSTPFSNIDKGGTKERTWIGYVNFITRFYSDMDLPDTSLFYWEYLSKKDTIDSIILYILNHYNVRDGNSLAAKLSPFKSVVFRLTGKDTVDALSTWGDTVIYARKNFNDIITEMGDQIQKKTTNQCTSVEPTSLSWTSAQEQLHNVSIIKNLDSRVRVLATIYKYGYILRMSTIFRTYTHLGDSGSREYYNYLDLENRIWNIIDDGVEKVSFSIPDAMAKELQVLTHGGSFCRGWLLPQRRGTAYAPEASLSSFSSWTKSGLLNYRSYKKIFMSWLKTEVPAEDYESFENVLDERLLFDQVSYTPPDPNYDLTETEIKLSDISKEIMIEPDKDLLVN